MAGTGSGYDLSVTTFSPDGRVFQVEYAAKAVDNSGTVLGIVCKDGIVLAAEKLLLSKMLVKGTNKRIFPVARHAGMATAGLIADGRQIVGRAQAEATQYKSTYCEKMPAKVMAERIGLFVHAYTLYWSVRPFGATALLAVYDDKEKALFGIEPDGVVHKFTGTAVGKGRQQAKTEIEKLKLEELSCKEALFHVAKIIHKIHDEKDKDFELEVSWICKETNYEHQLVPDNILGPEEQKAKDAIEAEEEAD